MVKIGDNALSLPQLQPLVAARITPTGLRTTTHLKMRAHTEGTMKCLDWDLSRSNRHAAQLK